jgi:EmrB/QacA subfamily drug resistance transporter
MEPVNAPASDAPAVTPPGGTNISIDPRARMEILFAILLALFLSALDQTIVGTALPTVVTQLHGNEIYVWVVTIYLLTSTITGPIYGKLSDQFGRRMWLMIGIGLFLAGSFLSGLSQDMVQLIVFRGIQGLGAGAIFPIALAVIGDLFTPQERGKYQGLFGAVFGISALVGPALGGFLTDNVSWHWVFFVNLPIGAVALAIIWRLLPAHQRTGVTRKVDYLGAFVFTLALVPILIGLTNGANVGWTDPWVGGLILLGVLIGIVFIWVESRAAEPIVPLDLFRNRTYTASMAAGFLASFGFFGAVIFLPRWYQVVNGSSATASGYQLLPLLGGLILSSVLSGQIVSRTGRYKWLIVGSLGILVVGLLLMTNLRADTPPPMLWLWQFITGLGIGPTFAIFTIVIQNSVPWQKLGVATSNLTFFRQIGGTIGLAIAGTVFASTLQTEAPAHIALELARAQAPQPVVDGIVGAFSQSTFHLNDLSGVGDMGAVILAQVPAQIRPLLEPYIGNIVSGIHQAFSLGIADTMWLSAIATVLALGATLTLREIPLRSTHNAENPNAARRPGAEVPVAD